MLWLYYDNSLRVALEVKRLPKIDDVRVFIVCFCFEGFFCKNDVHRNAIIYNP